MRDTLFKGTFGFLATAGGYAASKADIREWLQLTCLVGSVVIGILTVISLALTIEHKWRARKALKAANLAGFPTEETH